FSCLVPACPGWVKVVVILEEFPCRARHPRIMKMCFVVVPSSTDPEGLCLKALLQKLFSS
ncbi:MAG: hypothetical protein ONB46_02360, partial [candidate division KSB1 bacterium]|nr:hypothetical protein [candidate division KSB1 bacterium]